jgi:iron complex outermembrane recepter protein
MKHAMGTLAFSGAASLRKLAIAGGWILLMFCAHARADPDPSFDFKIAPQALATALVEFSQQAEVQVVGATAAIGAIRTDGVTGHFTGAEALERLLHGTELTARWKGLHTVTIVPAVKLSDTTPTRFDLQAKDLDQVLKDFELQSGLKVTATANVIAGKKGKSVHGDMTANDALRRLLKGSGLTFVRGRDDNITIQAVTAPAPVAVDSEGPVSADVSVQSQRVIQVYQPGGNVDIPRTIDDVQPYYIFNNEAIEESGATNIEDFLKQYLTMNSVVQTNSQIYGTLVNRGFPMGNTSTIDLRGLGSNQTLILVNGHRMAGVSVAGNSGQPDINGIPIAAVDHIEVLPSSSSGIYGGSAMGGAINIILKKNYKGGDLSYTREAVVSGHGFDSTVDGSYGFSLEGGKTQAMISAHYSDSEPLLLEDRAGLVEGGIRTLMQADPGIFGGGISAGLNPFQGGTFTNIVGLANCGPTGCVPAPLVLLNGKSLGAGTTTLCPGISPTSSIAAIDACLLKNAGTQNTNLSPGLGEFGLQQPIGYAPRVESLIASVNRSMSSWLDAFVDLTITKNDGSSEYNPIADQTWTVYAGSPTNPFQNSVNLHIPVENSVPLIADSLTRAITTGLTAQLPSGWRSELDFTWSENSFNSYYGQVNNDLFDGVATGPYAVPSGINGALETGAVNPFIDTGAYPQNVRPYIYPWSYGSSSTLNDVALRSTGPIVQLPWGNPIIAVAVEHREDGFPTSTQYSIYNTASTAAFDSHTTYFGQHQSTDSLYLEANVPLITERNALPGLRELALQATDRIERYDVVTGTSSEYIIPGGTLPSGTVVPPYICYSPALDENYSTGACQVPVPRAATTYRSNNHTVGLKYKPIESVTVRGSVATAFLPPNYSQLLPNPQVIPDGDTITDPKTGATYQVSTIGGGNPNLKPESDKNWDIGVIFEPQDDIFRGLRVDLEFVQIKRFDAILNLSGNQILSDAALASRVTRNPATGLITLINESAINASELKYEGYDLSINYVKPTGVGTFEFIGRASISEHNAVVYGFGQPPVDLVGDVWNGGQIKSSANGTLTWAKGPWKLGWTTRWFDGYYSQDPDGNELRIPSQVYHDLFAKYSVGASSSKLLANASVQFGIKDIFNTAPPYDPYFAPFYRSPIGDIHMQEWRLGVRKSF